MFATKVRIVHDERVETGRDPNTGQVFTMPTRTLAMAADEFGNVHVGEALCHPRDQFSRKFGRQAAEARLEIGYSDASPSSRELAKRHYFMVTSYEELAELIGGTDEMMFCYELVVRDIESPKEIQA
jgi:hypothetical protein